MKSMTSTKETLFSHEQLRDALFHIHDIMDRAQVPYLVLGSTARHMVENEEPLTGDTEVNVGAEKRFLTKEAMDTLRSFIPSLDVQKLQMTYEHKGIPVIIEVIHGDYKVFKNPDTKFYYIENFRVPNPFYDYWKRKDFMK